MTLTPDEQQLLDQVGRNPVFQNLVLKALSEEFKVLKVNTRMEQVCNAQGAVRILEVFQVHFPRN